MDRHDLNWHLLHSMSRARHKSPYPGRAPGFLISPFLYYDRPSLGRRRFLSLYASLVQFRLSFRRAWPCTAVSGIVKYCAALNMCRIYTGGSDFVTAYTAQEHCYSESTYATPLYRSFVGNEVPILPLSLLLNLVGY